MTLNGKKALKKLARKQAAYDASGGDKSPSGQKMHRPGTQNRNK